MTVTIIHANWVVPITSGVIEQGAVAVDAAGVIVAVGKAKDLLIEFPSAPRQQLRGAILPALVNAHTHVELSALRGLVAGGQGLVPWVQTLMPAARAIDSDEKNAAMHTAAAEMWCAGTAALGDVGNSLTSLPALASQPLQGTFFHELLGSQDTATGDAPMAARRTYEEVVQKGAWPARFTYVQAPHAPYSASPSLLRRVLANAQNLRERTTIHVAEDNDEIDLLMRGEGRWPAILSLMGVPLGERTPHLRPVPYLQAQGAFAGALSPLLVHMTFADAVDIEIAARFSAPVVLCPRSNLHITGQLPNIPALISAGVPLALGTDSLASNGSLSLWDEMATLAKHFPEVNCAHWLQAATHGGAMALDRPGLGSIAPGKKPGILNIDIECATENLLRVLTSKPPSNITWAAKP